MGTWESDKIVVPELSAIIDVLWIELGLWITWSEGNKMA